jgi:UDP-N-acetyl-D-galactosamine dehydrogenase
MVTAPQETVAVVGLGYVGLPLAVSFGKKIETIGFDLSEEKIRRYKACEDTTGQVSQQDFASATHLTFTADAAQLRRATVIIVAVPTPIDASNQPDLSHLNSASRIIGSHLQKGAVVVYESTVYPGVTEDFCAAVLEEVSSLRCGVDFYLGYSPERINPGDMEHTLQTIVKVVAAQDEKTLDRLKRLYSLVVTAGIYPVLGIKTAEAAKVIENTQRDLNIAFMNELAIIFHRLGLDTQEVLRAASTKWNFLPFKPGLVGGHCIGVDPYYLTHCAQRLGYHPEVILAGRRINDSMGTYVAQAAVKELVRAGVRVDGARVAVLGLSFKEDCPDTRNTRVVDILKELQEYGITPVVFDPVAGSEDARREYSIELLKEPPVDQDGVIIAVAHSVFRQAGPDFIKNMLKAQGKNGGVVVDVKALFDRAAFSNCRYWRL